MAADGMNTVTAVRIGGSGSWSLNSACWMSPCFGTALWGNECTQSAIGRSLYLIKTINAISSFSGINGMWRPHGVGNYYNSYANTSASLAPHYIVNNVGIAEGTLPYGPTPTDPYISSQAEYDLYLTRTDSFSWNGVISEYKDCPTCSIVFVTSSNGPQTFNGTSSIVNNFPYSSGYPSSSTDPVDAGGSGSQQFAPCTAVHISHNKTNLVVSIEGSKNMSFAGITPLGSNMPYYSLDWIMTTELSDPFDKESDFSTSSDLLLSSSFRCAKAQFQTSYSGSYAEAFPFYNASENSTCIPYNSGYADVMYTGSDEVASQCPLNNITCACGWSLGTNDGYGYKYTIEKGQGRLQPVLGGTYDSSYFVVEYTKSGNNVYGAAFTYQTWPLTYLSGLFTIVDGRLPFSDFRGNHTGSYFNYSVKVIDTGRIRSDQIIGYGAECDIQLPFPSRGPWGGPVKNGGDYDVPIESVWHAVVIGQDPGNWILTSGLTVPKFGNHFSLVTTSSVIVV